MSRIKPGTNNPAHMGHVVHLGHASQHTMAHEMSHVVQQLPGAQQSQGTQQPKLSQRDANYPGLEGHWWAMRKEYFPGATRNEFETFLHALNHFNLDGRSNSLQKFNTATSRLIDALQMAASSNAGAAPSNKLVLALRNLLELLGGEYSGS